MTEEWRESWYAFFVEYPEAYLLIMTLFVFAAIAMNGGFIHAG